jgi:site-specific DNA-methyltransferase (adenine-specific)
MAGAAAGGAAPFYRSRGGDVVLWQGDARDVLPMLQPGCADVVIADPPYGETSLAWDRWLDGWPALVLPLLKPSGSLWCFGSFRMFWEHRDEFSAYRLAQEIVWEKHNGSGFQADRFKRVHELVVQFYPRAAAWGTVYKQPQYTHDATARKVLRRNGGPPHLGRAGERLYVAETGGPRLMRSVLYSRSCHRAATNETQKPEGIVEPLLRYSCPPGGLVVDPFAGSGTVLAVARLLGLRAVGVELRADQCADVAARLAQGVLPGWSGAAAGG